MRLCFLPTILLLALSTPAEALAPAAAVINVPKGLSTYEMEGKIGPYVIGMNLTVRDHAEFVSGHYFYASKPLDIPLRGSVEGDQVTFREPGGGVFRLHLVTNESVEGRNLNFYVSTGLQGTWTQGSRTLPVSLGFAAGYDGNGPTRWYSDVTNEPDAAFEARVRKFLRAVAAGDKASAANSVSYPLRINGRTPSEVRTKADLLAKWDRIFTLGLRRRLRETIPHEMFVRNGLAMVAEGAVWFNAKGAAVINEME
jgi:hypothetical protein